MRRASSPSAPVVIRVTVARGAEDCSLVAVAMLTGRSYEDVLVEAAKIDRQAGRAGLWSTQIMRLAAALGMPLRRRRRFDLEDDTGILEVIDPKHKPDHVVVLKRGQVIDVDGTIWDVDAYLAHAQCQAGCLLTP